VQEVKILVGLSGSGKSSYARKYYLEHFNEPWCVYSSDAIRKELFGDENDQTHNAQVFDKMWERVKKCLDTNMNVIYDATNLSHRRRKHLINQIRSLRKDIFISVDVIMATPKECVFRQDLRDRKVPEEVIWRQLINFNIPTYDEGMNIINYVHTNSCTERDDYLLSVINSSQEIYINNPHHKLETIFAHCMEVEKYILNKVDVTEYFTYKDLGLYHDLGMVFTKVTDNNNIDHFYQHENASTYLSLLRPHLNEQHIIFQSTIIYYHMRKFNNPQYDLFIEHLPLDIKNGLLLLNEADSQYSQITNNEVIN
jgi:predicted kinase